MEFWFILFIFYASSQTPRQQKEHPVCFHYFTKAQRVVVIVTAWK